MATAGDRPHYEQPHRGTMLLVLGIVSIVACPIIGPFAWVMANKDLKEIDEGRMDPEGKSNTNVGKILGIVGTVLLGLQVLSFIFAIGMFALAASTAKPVPANNPAPMFKGK